MPKATQQREHILVDEETLRELRGLERWGDVKVWISVDQEPPSPAPSRLQDLIDTTLAALSSNREVSIREIPPQLTTTDAAQLLAISRPTLMKLIEAGEVAAVKVGTHTRVRREDVLALRDRKARARRRAFDELREMNLDDETTTC